MGGFECATHRRRDRTRIDVIARTQHDRLCAYDYQLLASAGIRTVRDGLRWHLIEANEGQYDWSSIPAHAAGLTHHRHTGASGTSATGACQTHVDRVQ